MCGPFLPLALFEIPLSQWSVKDTQTPKGIRCLRFPRRGRDLDPGGLWGMRGKRQGGPASGGEAWTVTCWAMAGCDHFAGGLRGDPQSATSSSKHSVTLQGMNAHRTLASLLPPLLSPPVHPGFARSRAVCELARWWAGLPSLFPTDRQPREGQVAAVAGVCRTVGAQ